jgi:hypothetical protein
MHVVGCTHVAILIGRPPPTTVNGRVTYDAPLPLKSSDPSTALYTTPAPRLASAGCVGLWSSHFIGGDAASTEFHAYARNELPLQLPGGVYPATGQTASARALAANSAKPHRRRTCPGI